MPLAQVSDYFTPDQTVTIYGPDGATVVKRKTCASSSSPTATPRTTARLGSAPTPCPCSAEGDETWGYSNAWDDLPNTWLIPAALVRQAAHHWALTHKMSDKVQ